MTIKSESMKPEGYVRIALRLINSKKEARFVISYQNFLGEGLLPNRDKEALLFATNVFISEGILDTSDLLVLTNLETKEEATNFIEENFDKIYEAIN